MALGGRVFAEYSTHGNPEWGLPSAIHEDGYPLRIWQVWRRSLCPFRTDEKFDGAEDIISPLGWNDTPPRPGR